jgi:hypothetical protein
MDSETVGQLATIRAVSAGIRGEVVVVRASGRPVFPPPLAGGRISECGVNDSGNACAHGHMETTA